MAAVEFLFAAPAFFIVVFFVVEIALIWNDRHIMRLAAYRAAKSVVKTRGDLAPNGGHLCWIPTSGPPSADDQKVKDNARRAAVKIMALVTPSIEQLLPSFGSSAGSAISTQINSDPALATTATTAGTDYMHAILRVMKGLPAAWIFTELDCKDVSPDMVEVTVTYNRSAKMPYIGNVMWALHEIAKLGSGAVPGGTPGGGPSDGNTGYFRIDPLTYGLEIGVNLSSPAVIADVKAQILKIVADLGTSSGATNALNTAGLPASSIFESAANAGMGAIGGTGGFVTAVAGAQTIVNTLSTQLENFIVLIPDQFKTIPIHVSVRVADFNSKVENSTKDWVGETTLLGKLGVDSTVMGKMVRQMGAVVDSHRNENDLANKVHADEQEP